MIIPASVAIASDADLLTGENIATDDSDPGFDPSGVELEITGEIKENMTIKEGELAYIIGDVILSPNVTITIEKGAELMMSLMTTFSIAGGSGSAFVFEEGSYLSLGMYEFEFDEFTEIYINGKLAYSLSFTFPSTGSGIKATASMDIDENTVFVDNFDYFNFEGGVKIKADIDVLNNPDDEKNPFVADIDATIDAGKMTVTVGGTTAVLESMEASIEGDAKSTKAGDSSNFELDLDFESKTVISADGNKMTAEESGNVKATVKGMAEGKQISDMDIDVSGKLTSTIESDDIVSEFFTLKGFKAVTTIEIGDFSLEETTSFSAKEISLNVVPNDGDSVLLNLEGFKYEDSSSIDIGDFMDAVKDGDLPSGFLDVNAATSLFLRNSNMILALVDLESFDAESYLDLVDDYIDIEAIDAFITANGLDEFLALEDYDDFIILDSLEPYMELLLSLDLSDIDYEDGPLSFIELDALEAYINAHGIESFLSLDDYWQFIDEDAREDYMEEYADDSPIDFEKIGELFDLIEIDVSTKCSVDSFSLEISSETEKDIASIEGYEFSASLDNDKGFELSIKTSADSVFYKHDYENGYAMYDIGKMSASVVYDDGWTATMKVGSATIVNGSGSHQSVAEANKLSVTAKLIPDFRVSIGITGDICTETYSNYTLAYSSNLDDLDMEVIFDLSDIRSILTSYDITKMSCKMKTVSNGIALDYGKISYDPQTGDISSKKVSISGTSTSYNPHSAAMYYDGVLSVSGTLYDVTNSRTGYYNGFSSYDIEFKMLKGGVLKQNYKIENGKVISVNDVKGDIGMTEIGQFMTSMGFEIYPDDMDSLDLTVKGDGRLISYALLDPDFVNLTGKLYIEAFIDMGDYTLNVEGLEGAMLSINDGIQKLTISADPGYTLDPSTFDGFTVVDGYVVLDKTKIEDGVLHLSTQSIGNSYVLTVDGSKKDVRYGDFVELNVPLDVIWFVDQNGMVYDCDEGTMFFMYSYLGDLSLTSVKAKSITVFDYGVVNSSSDNVVFDLPDDFNTVGVKLPNGLIAFFESDMYWGQNTIKVATEKIKYDGKDAYDITINGQSLMYFPATEKTKVFHIINGESVEMSGQYVIYDGQGYFVTGLSAYSTFVVSESEPGSGSGINLLYVAIIILIIIVIIAVVLAAKRKKKSA